MADPRLLMHGLALCTLCSVLEGCAFGPIWARTIEGQVTDAETGHRVAGAEVFASYNSFSLADATASSYAYRWATTDSEGRFTISGRPATRFWAIGWVSRWNPDVAVLDRRYGTTLWEFSIGRPPDDWRHLALKIRRDPKEIEKLNSAKSLSELCSMDAVECFHACELWYGDQGCSSRRKQSGR